MHPSPHFSEPAYPWQVLSVVRRHHGYKVDPFTNEVIYLTSVSIYLFRRILLFRYYINSAR